MQKYKIKPNTVGEVLLIAYWFGALLMWAYIIAWIDSNKQDATLVAIIMGWVPALAWPLIIAVFVMQWLFFNLFNKNIPKAKGCQNET